MKVLVVANDHVGSRMAGPGIRALRFATELAADHDVTLVVPFATDLVNGRIAVVQDDPWDPRRMRDRIRGHDVVVAQKLPVSTMRALGRSETRAIYDLYDPVLIEALAWGSHHPASSRIDAANRLNAVTQEVLLASGDAFVCASERQRDLWLGSLLQLGRVDQAAYSADPSLRSLIDVVPFGVEPEPPLSERRVLRGVVPGIGDGDRILLWGGGVWNWLDPLTVIEAVGRLSKRREDVRLYFLGLARPNRATPEMRAARRAVERAGELGLTGRVVFFNESWVPYEERGAYYLEADLGVSAHFDDLETRFAFRTRLLDCFWAGLPVVTTRGDALGELVGERGLGRTVGVGDVDGWVEAIDALLDDRAERTAIAERLGPVRDALAWPRVVEPLRRLVATAGTGGHAPPLAATARYARARAENALLQHGPREAAARGVRWATGRVRPLEERLRPPQP